MPGGSSLSAGAASSRPRPPGWRYAGSRPGASPAGPGPGRCPSGGGTRPPPAGAPGFRSPPTTGGRGWPAQDRPAQDRPRPAKPAEPGPRVPRPGSRRHETATPWAELHCHSSFSFLDGAAIPDELVAEAARLGLEVLAITDHDGMYGVPQFAQAARRLADHGIRLGTVVRAELRLPL